MAAYGYDTMKNALMLTTEDRGMGESLKAMDRVKWTTGMLKVHAIDPRMTADDIIDFISEKMTIKHRNEAQHQDRGGQRNWVPRHVRQTDAEIADTSATPAKRATPKSSAGSPDVTTEKPRSPYPDVGVQAVDAILAEVFDVQSMSQRKRKEPRRWGTPPLSFHEFREQHGGRDGKGGCFVCYGQHRDHRHDHTRCDVAKREKTEYFKRHPEKVSQRDQRNGRDPRQHRQIDTNGDRYAELLVQIQDLRNQLGHGQPRASSGPNA